MKNLQWHTNTNDRKAYIKSQFSSDKYFEVPEIEELLDKAARLPIVWFDYSNEDIERLHFSAWWNCIARRHGVYSNPVIRDLYLFHEIFHVVDHNKHGLPSSFDEFVIQRINEERLASFFSEVHIYNLIPSIRQKTFDFPILWDEIKNLSRPDQFHERILCESIEGNSPARKLVYKYAKDNQYWCQLWKEEFYQVEIIYRKLKSTNLYGEFVCSLSSFAKESIPWYHNAVRFKQYLET